MICRSVLEFVFIVVGFVVVFSRALDGWRYGISGREAQGVSVVAFWGNFGRTG